MQERSGMATLTFPVNLCSTHRETVTVAVFFINPALVTIPLRVIGGMVET